MPGKKDRKPPETEKATTDSEAVWFKHSLNNCTLTLEMAVIKEGKPEIAVNFKKDPAVPWGFVRISDPKTVELVKTHSFFGKKIFLATEQEKEAYAKAAKPKYQQGVAGAVLGKGVTGAMRG